MGMFSVHRKSSEGLKVSEGLTPTYAALHARANIGAQVLIDALGMDPREVGDRMRAHAEEEMHENVSAIVVRYTNTTHVPMDLAPLRKLLLFRDHKRMVELAYAQLSGNDQATLSIDYDELLKAKRL